MRVEVREIYAGRRRQFVGGEAEVRADLLQAYPSMLAKYGPDAPLDVLVSHLNAMQAYTARVARQPLAKMSAADVGADSEEVGRMLGHSDDRDQLLGAARFLARRDADMAVYRRSLASGLAPGQASLASVGLDPSEDNLAALDAVLGALGALKKAEAVAEKPVSFSAVVPDQDGAAFAAEVLSASAAGSIHRVTLGGKHSGGALISYDQEANDRLLLKPGSGGDSPALGAGDSSSDQASREAAFYAAACAAGLRPFFQECHVLTCDGRRYAAMRMVGASWRTMDELQRENQDGPRRELALPLQDGTLHKLAMLDAILGNVDRHANNIMMRGGDLRLIDHGSAFAGSNFSPATDPDVFTPAYLRAGIKNFEKLAPDQKLAALPRLSAEAASALGSWLMSIDDGALGRSIEAYGIDPAPELARLRALRAACRGVSPDVAVNAFWTLP